jgi:hypothetical protein
MSKECPYQTKDYKIRESRCIIPLRLQKGNSWFCNFHGKELECPIRKIIASKHAIECHICYDNELLRISEIKESDLRFYGLQDFFLKLQDVCFKEVKRIIKCKIIKSFKEYMNKKYKKLKSLF